MGLSSVQLPSSWTWHFSTWVWFLSLVCLHLSISLGNLARVACEVFSICLVFWFLSSVFCHFKLGEHAHLCTWNNSGRWWLRIPICGSTHQFILAMKIFCTAGNVRWRIEFPKLIQVTSRILGCVTVWITIVNVLRFLNAQPALRTYNTHLEFQWAFIEIN